MPLELSGAVLVFCCCFFVFFAEMLRDCGRGPCVKEHPNADLRVLTWQVAQTHVPPGQNRPIVLTMRVTMVIKNEC